MGGVLAADIYEGISHTYIPLASRGDYFFGIDEDEDFSPAHRSFLADASLDDGEVLQAVEKSISEIEGWIQRAPVGEDVPATCRSLKRLQALLEFRRDAFGLFQSMDSWTHSSIRAAVNARREDERLLSAGTGEDRDEKGDEEAVEEEPPVRVAEKAPCLDGLDEDLAVRVRADLQTVLDRAELLSGRIKALQTLFPEPMDAAAMDQELQFAFRPQVAHLIHSGLTRVPSIKPFAESLEFLSSISSQISAWVAPLHCEIDCLGALSAGSAGQVFLPSFLPYPTLTLTLCSRLRAAVVDGECGLGAASAPAAAQSALLLAGRSSARRKRSRTGRAAAAEHATTRSLYSLPSLEELVT